MTGGPSAPGATVSRPGGPGHSKTPGYPECPLTVPATMLIRVQLTKHEVFAACQALADADPILVAAGRLDEARALGDLFELLEDRLTRS